MRRLLALGLAWPALLTAQLANDSVEQRLRSVHMAAAPLDAHVDVLVSTTPGIYRTDDGVSQVTIDKLVAGGMAAVTLALQSPTGPATPAGVAAARAEVDAKLARIRMLVADNPTRLELALTADDIERSRSNGYAFQIETVFRAWHAGFRVGELPIVFVDRNVGASKMSKRIVWEAIWMVWRMRWWKLTGRLHRETRRADEMARGGAA